MPFCYPRRASHPRRWMVSVAAILAVLCSTRQEPLLAQDTVGSNAEQVQAALTPTVALTETELAVASFQGFCNEWLEKLVHREEQNLGRIEWATSELGVRGVFVGYSRRGQCEAKTGTDAVPVGKLTYKQITYEKKGPTVAAAEISAARPLDVAEVTEIFHYADGKWIY